MIAVVGLLLTTIGGNDEENRLGAGFVPSSVEPDSGQPMLPDNFRSLVDSQSEVIDVQLHTQAHMPTSGGTPTPTPVGGDAVPLGQPSTPHDTGGVGSVTTEMEAQSGYGSGVETIICAYPWPQGCEYWTSVAWCESTLGQDPNAYADWNPYVGLFQIWIGHNYERGWLKDDANNTLAAWELSHEGTRTSPWPWCQYR